MHGQLLIPIIKENFFEEQLKYIRDLIHESYELAFEESKDWHPGNRSVSLPHRRLALINERLHELSIWPDIAVDEFQTDKHSYSFTVFRIGNTVTTHHYRQKSGQRPRESSLYPRQLATEKLDLFPDYQFSKLQPPPDCEGYFVLLLHGSENPVCQKPDFIDIGLPRDGDCKLIDLISMEDAIRVAPNLEVSEPERRPEVVIRDDIEIGFDNLPKRKES